MATKTEHRVKAAAAVINAGTATERYLYRGARVPTGVSAEELKRLTSLGLVEAIAVEEKSDRTPPAPTKPAANAGLDKQKAWAERLGIEVPADADKAKVLELIAAHEAAQSQQ